MTLKPKPFLETSKSVEFVESTHTYYLNSKKLSISASQANPLNAIYYAKLGEKIADFKNILERARIKGKAVHKFVEIALKTNFDEQKIRDFVNGNKNISKATLKTMKVLWDWLKKFMGERQLLMSETMLLSSEIEGLVGTFDLFLYNKTDDCYELIDIKSSDWDKVNKDCFEILYHLQLAIYEHLIRCNFFVDKKIKRYIIFTGGKNIIKKSV